MKYVIAIVGLVAAMGLLYYFIGREPEKKGSGSAGKSVSERESAGGSKSKSAGERASGGASASAGAGAGAGAGRDEDEDQDQDQVEAGGDAGAKEKPLAVENANLLKTEFKEPIRDCALKNLEQDRVRIVVKLTLDVDKAMTVKDAEVDIPGVVDHQAATDCIKKLMGGKRIPIDGAAKQGVLTGFEYTLRFGLLLDKFRKSAQ